MLEILFIDEDTGRVNYAITDIRLIRHITPSEIGFTTENGSETSCAFKHTERLEIVHKTDSPQRAALVRAVREGAVRHA